jgi:hypothetical protein
MNKLASSLMTVAALTAFAGTASADPIFTLPPGTIIIPRACPNLTPEATFPVDLPIASTSILGKTFGASLAANAKLIVDCNHSQGVMDMGAIVTLAGVPFPAIQAHLEAGVNSSNAVTGKAELLSFGHVLDTLPLSTSQHPLDYAKYVPVDPLPSALTSGGYDIDKSVNVPGYGSIGFTFHAGYELAAVGGILVHAYVSGAGVDIGLLGAVDISGTAHGSSSASATVGGAGLELTANGSASLHIVNATFSASANLGAENNQWVASLDAMQYMRNTLQAHLSAAVRVDAINPVTGGHSNVYSDSITILNLEDHSPATSGANYRKVLGTARPF